MQKQNKNSMTEERESNEMIAERESSQPVNAPAAKALTPTPAPNSSLLPAI